VKDAFSIGIDRSGYLNNCAEMAEGKGGPHHTGTPWS
jgi:hypothetical protein